MVGAAGPGAADSWAAVAAAAPAVAVEAELSETMLVRCCVGRLDILVLAVPLLIGAGFLGREEAHDVVFDAGGGLGSTDSAVPAAAFRGDEALLLEVGTADINAIWYSRWKSVVVVVRFLQRDVIFDIYAVRVVTLFERP